MGPWTPRIFHGAPSYPSDVSQKPYTSVCPRPMPRLSSNRTIEDRCLPVTTFAPLVRLKHCWKSERIVSSPWRRCPGISLCYFRWVVVSKSIASFRLGFVWRTARGIPWFWVFIEYEWRFLQRGFQITSKFDTIHWSKSITPVCCQWWRNELIGNFTTPW